MQLVLCAVSLALMCTVVNSQGGGCMSAVEQCQQNYRDEITTSAASDAYCVFAQHLIDCIFASPDCSFNEDAKQQIIEGTYSPLKEAGIDCDDECTVGVQECSVKSMAMIADGTVAKIGNCRYVQSVLDCQFAACPALTDDEKQALKDNFLTQLKEGGIDCYNQCQIAQNQCGVEFQEVIKDGRAQKLGLCQFSKDLLDCYFASECVFTETDKQVIINQTLSVNPNGDCEYNL